MRNENFLYKNRHCKSKAREGRKMSMNYLKCSHFLIKKKFWVSIIRYDLMWKTEIIWKKNNNSLCQNTRHMDAQGRNTSGRNHSSISSLDVSGGIAIRPGPAGQCNIPIPQSSASSPAQLNGIALSVPPAAACLEVSLSWHMFPLVNQPFPCWNGKLGPLLAALTHGWVQPVGQHMSCGSSFTVQPP